MIKRFAPDGSGEFVDPLVTDVTEDKYVYVDRSRSVRAKMGNCCES